MLVTKDGRTPEGIESRIPARTPAQALEFIQQLAEVGTDHAIFNMPKYTDPNWLDIWASDIVPQVKKMAVAGR